MALNLGSVFFNLGANTKGLRRAARDTKAFGNNAKQSMDKASRAAKKTEKRLKLVSKAANRLKGAFAIAVVLESARRTALLADKYNILQQRIKTATAATGDYNEVSRELYAISNRNGTALDTNVKLFQALARTAPELNASNREMLTLTELLGQLGTIGGSSAEQMNNGLLQFSQAMASGILRAEEMNSLLENTPEIAARIAKGMGLTVGQLRLAVLEGKVLSKDVYNSLIKQSKEIAKEMAALPLTIDRASTTLANSFQKFVGKVDEASGITKAIAETLKGASNFLESANIDDFVEGARKVGFYLAAAATVRLGVLIASVWSLTAALRASRLALIGTGWGALIVGLGELAAFLDKHGSIAKGIDAITGASLRANKADLQSLMELRPKRVQAYGTDSDTVQNIDAKIKELKSNIAAAEREEREREIAKAAERDRRRERLETAGSGHFESSIRDTARETEAEKQRNLLADKREALQAEAKIIYDATTRSFGVLTDSLLTKQEILDRAYKEDLATLKAAEDQKQDTIIPYGEKRIRLEKKYNDASAALDAGKGEGLATRLAELKQSLMSEGELREKALAAQRETLKESARLFPSPEAHAALVARFETKQSDIKAAAAKASNDSLIQAFGSEREIAQLHYDTRIEQLLAFQQEVDLSDAAFNARKRIEKQKLADDLAAIDNKHLKGVGTAKKIFALFGLKQDKKNYTDKENADEAAFYKQVSLAEGHSRVLFNAQKSLAIAQALIDGPSAILSAFNHGTKLGGAPLGAIFAGVAAAATAVQIAAISSASFSGSRATGGSVSAGNLYNVNERKGPELLTMSGGSQALLMGDRGGRITPNNKLGGGSNVVVKIYPTEGETATVQETQNGDTLEISVMIEKIERKISEGIDSGHGIVDASMRNQYGLNRANGGY